MIHVSKQLPKLKAPIPTIPNKPKAPSLPSMDNTPDYKTPSTVSKPDFKAADPENGLIELDSNDWVLTQTTAVCGFEMNPNGSIPRDMIKYVNENGNSWEYQDIMKYWKTFIGGHNFYEHNQDPKLSYGFLADATLRDIKTDSGKKLVYVDVVVATNISKSPNRSVVSRIKSGELNTLSMGCVSDGIRCSKCGYILSDEEDEYCECLRTRKGRQYLNGRDVSVISAVIHSSDKNGNIDTGVDFYELSWVETPAFAGANGHYRFINSDKEKIYIKMPMASINRTDGWDAVKYWESKGALKIKPFMK